ncbi:hypothetical protein KW850_20280 [Bacillus sp. sid0103]|nr:hypothetical protein [Bacillus sp. sid0103]MBV7507571.1 hypothetical protein [Bacillus sp. sid0103]
MKTTNPYKNEEGGIMAEILFYLGTYLSAALALGWLISCAFDLFFK